MSAALAIGFFSGVGEGAGGFLTTGPPGKFAISFYERPTLIPVFSKQKKFEENFRFYKKMLKMKIVSSICLAARVTEAAHAPGEQQQRHHREATGYGALVLGWAGCSRASAIAMAW